MAVTSRSLVIAVNYSCRIAASKTTARLPVHIYALSHDCQQGSIIPPRGLPVRVAPAGLGSVVDSWLVSPASGQRDSAQSSCSPSPSPS
jgi:hypothetical protein